MPKIIFNYKICDKAPECGGIANCPNHAISFDNKLKRPVWDESKCSFCLRCTMPDSCPVGAIMYAADEQQEKLILDTIASDPVTEDWLWLERYGTFPGQTQPLATILNLSNINYVLSDSGTKLVDIWHPDFVDCRLHSPLFSDLIHGKDVPIYKLNAQDFPQLASQLGVTSFPTLFVYKNGQIIFTHTGYVKKDSISDIIQKINKLI